MWDRDKVVEAFQGALEELASFNRRSLRPRTVAVRAHRRFLASLRPGEKGPALMTFCLYVAGKSALPEIVDLLERAGVRAISPARLDRGRVRAVFQEAIRRLEASVLKGRVKPLQVARRAHQLYTQEMGENRPSPYTFQRLIYGKEADPDIAELLAKALRREGKNP